MTPEKLDLNEAFHALAAEAMADRIRFEKRREMVEVFDMLWGTDWDKKRNYCCKTCEGQERENGIHR